MSMCAPILAAEDEETDCLLLRMALKKSGLQNPLFIAQDGQDAVDYLSGVPPYRDRVTHPFPGLLLLDLKMPRMNGFEVLAWLAERPTFQTLPVVVLSSSTNDSDIKKARQLGAREYLVKPNDFRKLTKILQDLAARWLNGGTAEVPRTSEVDSASVTNV